jgi:chromosome segregation protein
LNELAVNEAELLPLLGRSVKALAAEIARLSQQLASLGPVNLAAMQELVASQERDAYLKAQASDLEQAMATLSSAIARIDKETRSLLQTTYDTVNANLQELFPALFGGGHAELILTGDEILDAGMSIMAQPPGKKNATIHLLSGGEKALTALSLVFSLFKLNPAPFCLLDEVDAPLDDANTLRFCELVKKMAQFTQFLYISHNKLTMEMAQQLVGVTMQEQGVSRIVAVDIEAALKMREPELI